MLSKLKAALSNLMNAGGGGSADAAVPPVEYNGYRIRPAPYRNKDHYHPPAPSRRICPTG